MLSDFSCHLSDVKTKVARTISLWPVCILVSCYNITYALVICNHGPPTPGAGRGIAVEMSGVFTFALSPQCGGNTRDLCYIGKNGGAMKT